MDIKEFNGIVEKQIKRSTDVLITKAGEYATDGDRLHNFKTAAALTGESVRQTLGGFMAKHTVSIYDMIQSNKDYPIEMWNEKITDHINYLLLLAAVVRDTDSDEEVTIYADGKPYMKVHRCEFTMVER